MKKVFLDTLGCPKNFDDSDYIRALLNGEGYEFVEVPEEADVVIVNTCGFIEDAKKESIEHIFDASDRKNENAKLIVTGCLAQRYAEELFDEMPEADAFLGVNDYDRLPDILAKTETSKERAVLNSPCNLDYLEKRDRKLDGKTYSATLRIGEGCDRKCAYCIIPEIRGKYRSKRMEDVIAEAGELADLGCKELILIAQDVTYYGVDLYGKEMLPELLRELCKIDGIRWIKLMYCYDDRITDELIEVMASEEKICHYIDIPLQHGSDSILKAMRRRSDRKAIEDVIYRLRKAMPDIVIRTTLIVGFPGETEEDFSSLLDMVEKEKFGRLGAFKYSREEGTEAYNMPNQVDEEIKERRLDAVMMRQLNISLELNQGFIGKTIEVMVEGRDEDGSYLGRSRYDAPEIDNGVIFTSERKLEEGDIVQVLITDAFDYDLVGTVI